ncbi:hypothetical protein NQZ68_001944 [Dissostichus eleginoides]|nr:hypothetical protein NQZ68_001944 [Dissostichus eleginoides]
MPVLEKASDVDTQGSQTKDLQACSRLRKTDEGMVHKTHITSRQLQLLMGEDGLGFNQAEAAVWCQ